MIINFLSSKYASNIRYSGCKYSDYQRYTQNIYKKNETGEKYQQLLCQLIADMETQDDFIANGNIITTRAWNAPCPCCYTVKYRDLIISHTAY